MQADKYIYFLLEQAQQGNRNKYLEFCELYYEEIFKIIYKLAPNNDFARNLTVEVFITAYSNLRLISLEANFTYWLKSLAIRLTLQALKEKQKLEEDSFHKEYLENEPSSFKNVLSNYFTLPNHFRVAVILFLQEDYEIADIKELLLQLFNYDEENFLEISFKKLFSGSDYEWLLDLDQDRIIEICGSLKKNSFISLSDKEELLQDLVQRFNIFFRKVDTPALIPLGIKEFLFDDSKISAEKKKQQSKLLAELQKEVEVSKEKKKEEKTVEEAVPKKKKGNGILTLLIMTILFAGLYYYKFVYTNVDWNANATSYVIIDGEKIKFENVNEGEKFSVKGDKPLKLRNNLYGEIVAYNGTGLSFVTGNKKLSVVNIYEGNISVNSIYKNSQSTSLLKGKDFIVKDFGSEFNLSVSKTGKGSLKVKEGSVLFRINSNEFLLSEGITILFNGKSFSIPFHYSASKTLQEACKDYIVTGNISAFYDVFKRERKVSDTSTIWALYLLSSGEIRKDAANIIFNEFNIPENISLTDIIEGNKETILKLEREFMWQLY